MKISRQSTLMILSMALLLAFASLTGCVQNQGADTSGAAVELTDSTVRVPPGDPTKFWDSMGWVELTKAEQALWAVLGWNEASWEGEAKQPASEDKYWKSLNDEERSACKKLSYTKRLWDNS
jgi:hypothetical protein